MKIIVLLSGLALILVGCSAPEQTSIPPILTSPPAQLGTFPVPPDQTPEASEGQSCLFAQDDPYLQLRLDMVNQTIEMRGVEDSTVLRAMRCVPRHEFVPADYLERSYGDHPLPIGYGQTISQPYIVAWMTELIELEAGDKVLEIGTGSGYQAAVLAELGGLEIYSIEIVPELADIAEQRLKRLGYTGIHLRQDDGYYGWSEDSRFDAIIVTAAPDHLPAPLAAQLAEGGRLVIPIGPQGGFQTLWVWVNEQGEIKAYNMGMVSFVPLTGEGVKLAPAVPPF
jgi:protein-L-isoaspartate(D-aspartate) O-methyltransferase